MNWLFFKLFGFHPDREQRWHRFLFLPLPLEVEDDEAAKTVNRTIGLILFLLVLLIALVIMAFSGLTLPFSLPALY